MTDALAPDGPAPGLATPRLATVADAGEVVRLAGVMYRELGAAPPALSTAQFADWERAAAIAVRRRLGQDLVVVVCDDPQAAGRPVACGAGNVAVRLPNAWHRDPRVGYVQWMSTDPAHRRQGHARAVLRRLMAWFAAEGIGTVELHASAGGAPLYRSEGFWGGSTGLAMRHRAWDPPPGETTGYP